jgi:hypothetical protein
LKQTLLLFILLFGITRIVLGQDQIYHIHKTDQPILIDGVMNDDEWSDAEVSGSFTQYFPMDSVRANSQTEIRLLYDDQFIYFSAKMYNQKDDREYVVSSLRRDFKGNQIDGISFLFDTFQDQTNAFHFGVNSFGAQREGLLAGGFGGTSWSWDNKWYAESKQYEGYWIAEGAIPFKSIRYKEGMDEWNVNYYRHDSEEGERSVWSPVPRNYNITSLAFTGVLKWDEPLKKTGPNISLIPYTAFDITRDYEKSDENSPKSNLEIGGDAKIAIGAGLNLDLTVNPDFSQVEVDQQVTNLDRFELFFPEKRQFFLENADLFSNFGHPFYSKVFHSRRIGIVTDTVNDETIQNKILYGARLSGKLDNNWRIGLINMQTEKIESIHLPSFNYTVAALQRKIFARSNVGVIFVNKQSFDETTDDPLFDPTHYNRVLGLDYNIATADNKWRGKVTYQKSWDTEKNPEEFAHSGWIGYQGRRWEADWAHTIVGKNFNAELGFVPRNGFYRIQNQLGYNFYPNSNIVNRHKLEVEAEFFWRDGDAIDQSLRKSDHNLELKEVIHFQNTGRFRISFQQRYTYLFDSFDPTNSDGKELPANSDYTYHFSVLSYSSDSRKQFNIDMSGQIGEYYNGYRYRISSGLNFRVQPFAAFNVNINYNRINLPKPYKSADLILIGSRIDLTMTKKLFFTSFLQYNTQATNFNINTRLQWRFKPVSDLFIVYTDNYTTETLDGDYTFQKKNRALVIRFTYWLNL